VNMPSPEALLRSILIGNDYFEKQFGLRCVDIFLPDCFGFGAALPSVMAHCGLYGFITCKLSWGSVHGRPFDLGRWHGVDGNYVFAGIRPGHYSASLGKFRGDEGLANRVEENAKNYNMPFTLRLYGTGDMGGSPSTLSVKTLNREAGENNASGIKIIPAAARDVFDAIRSELTEEEIAALPSHNGEFLLTDHGVGSYTARTVSNRWNRRCEQLADAAERACVAAERLGAADYPAQQLNTAWKRFLSHHFHDDITGTAFDVCYKRNWNDYVMSMNQLAQEYTAANRAVASRLDTGFAEGIPVVVNNTLAFARKEAVSVNLPFDHARVVDCNGNEVPSQVNDGIVTFIAEMEALSWKVYDVQNTETQITSSLAITENSLENEKLYVTFNADGDITSIFDKQNNREALSKPIRMAVLPDHSMNWPAWELRYEDAMSEDKRYPGSASFRILERGPARVTLEITRKLGETSFLQSVSLDAGAAYVRIYNEVDWRGTKSMLKAEFPLAVSNENAAYDIGLGVKERGTNSEKLYEVPFQQWMDITQGDYGVSILNDSKSGADKPSDDTLRLTLVHTPAFAYRWEASQHLMDQGHNRFSFGIYPHAGGWQNGTQAAAAAFNQPMAAFIADKHPGSLGSDYAFGALHGEGVILRAVKKAEHEDKIVVRFNEGSGREAKNIRFALTEGIESAVETLAVETYLRDAIVENGELVFDMKPFEIKTFVLTMSAAEKSQPKQEAIALPYNITAVTANGSPTRDITVPMELFPGEITSGGVTFKTSHRAMKCAGQVIPLPAGTRKAHLLLCSLDGDVTAPFGAQSLTVQSAFEAIGAWDLVSRGEMGYIKRGALAWNATHCHGLKGNLIGKHYYLFQHSIDIDTDSLQMPADERILVFAITADFEGGKFKAGMPLYDEQTKRPCDYTISKDDLVKARPSKTERFLEHILPRETIITGTLPGARGTFSVGDAWTGLRHIFAKNRAKKGK